MNQMRYRQNNNYNKALNASTDNRNKYRIEVKRYARIKKTSD